MWYLICLCKVLQFSCSANMHLLLLMLMFSETVAGELINTCSRPLFWNIIHKSMQTEYAHATAGTLFNIYWNVYLRDEALLSVFLVLLLWRDCFLYGHCYINGKNSISVLACDVQYLLYFYRTFADALNRSCIQVVHYLESSKTDWPKKGNHVLKHLFNDN